MRVVVDSNLCQGHGRCAALAPDVYELDDDGFNAITELTVPPGMEEQARRGAEACPEAAIRVEE